MSIDTDTDTVLGKAMAILEAFRVHDQAVPLAELVRRTGLHKATVHRLAGELAARKVLDKLPDGYRLGLGLFELGMRASVGRGLLELSMPFLQDLYERTHEIVHLGVREGTEVVYIAKIGGHRQARSPSRLGGRMPIHCTGIGKALLAHEGSRVRNAVLSGPLTRRTSHTVIAAGLLRRQLDAVLETGVAFEREESAIGIACVAAPILGPDESAVAAISVTGPVPGFRPEAHIDAVRAAATAVGVTLARTAALADASK